MKKTIELTEKQLKDLENVKNIKSKLATGQKLSFAERNILNIFKKRNRKK